uniref:Uncharacterized protein n=1 Tax=Arundo donax TaxID=35708 RepID=A0A0A8YWI6_ARUDO
MVSTVKYSSNIHVEKRLFRSLPNFLAP